MNPIPTMIVSLLLGSCASTAAKTLQGGKEPAQAASLVGMWESPCLRQESGYLKTLRFFAAETVEIEKKFFTTSDCTGSPYQVLTIGANYSVGEGVAGDPTPLDVIYTAASLTVNEQTFVTSYNDQKYFEREDWAVGVANNVLDRAPLPGQSPMVSKGQGLYALFQIVEGKLYHADFSTGDGATPERRPTSINATSGDLRVN